MQRSLKTRSFRSWMVICHYVLYIDSVIALSESTIYYKLINNLRANIITFVMVT